MEKIEAEQIKTAVAKAKEENPDIDANDLEKMLTAVVQKNQSIKEAMGLSDKFMELAYSSAYNMFQAGKFSDAIDIFKVLEMLDATDSKYSLGTAKCYENMEEWELALNKYFELMQYETDPNYIWSAYLCVDKLKNRDLAMTLLGMLYFVTEADPEYEALNEKAEMLLSKLTGDIAVELEAQAGGPSSAKEKEE